MLNLRTTLSVRTASTHRGSKCSQLTWQTPVKMSCTASTSEPNDVSNKVKYLIVFEELRQKRNNNQITFDLE